jgi:hypothetical protein
MPQHYLAGFGGERAEIQLKPAKEVSHRAKTTVNRNATKGTRSTSMPGRPVPLPFNFEARRELTEDPLVDRFFPLADSTARMFYGAKFGNS